MLPKLEKESPALDVALATTEGVKAHEGLLSGAFDLILDAEPPRLSGVVSETLYTDRFCFFAAPTLSEKVGEPGRARTLIYVPNAIDSKRVSLRETLAGGGAEFDRRYELDTFEAVKALAVAGLGLAVLPLRLAEREVRRGALVAVSVGAFKKRGFGEHRIAASVRSTDLSLPRTSALIRFLQRQFKASLGL